MFQLGEDIVLDAKEDLMLSFAVAISNGFRKIDVPTVKSVGDANAVRRRHLEREEIREELRMNR